MDFSQQPDVIHEKSNAQIEVNSASDIDYSNESAIQEQKGGSKHDVYDMSRMGKRQELRRNFRFISIVGFVMVLQSTWESILLAAQYGLVNGGTAGVIWMTVGVIVGALCMIASIAEMASMLVILWFRYGGNIQAIDKRVLGPQLQAVNITGCLNLRLNPGRSLSAISWVSPEIKQMPIRLTCLLM